MHPECGRRQWGFNLLLALASNDSSNVSAVSCLVHRILIRNLGIAGIRPVRYSTVSLWPWCTPVILTVISDEVVSADDFATVTKASSQLISKHERVGFTLDGTESAYRRVRPVCARVHNANHHTLSEEASLMKLVDACHVVDLILWSGSIGAEVAPLDGRVQLDELRVPGTDLGVDGLECIGVGGL